MTTASADAKPESVDAQLMLIEEAVRNNLVGEALKRLRQLPPGTRKRFDVMARESDLLGKAGEHDAELALYPKLIAMQPKSAGVRLGLAHALKTVGRTAEAVQAVRDAIALQPTYGQAWWLLSDLKHFAFAQDDVAAMESALKAGNDPADRLHLHFALGGAMEQAGRHAEAFDHYAKANALRAAQLSPKAMTVTQRVDRTIETCTAEFFADRGGFGADSDAPIFIVGLHRSGSTLIEQILASHPEIEATSELPLIPQLFREVGRDQSLPGSYPVERMAALNRTQSRKLGQAYMERAQVYRRIDKRHFTDKLPANWLYVGFVRLILPNAKIIDARRHPMAAGFSNFRQNYASGVEWSYSLTAIGHYYRDYLRLMEHFDRVQPGAVHRVINERLIDNFEPEVRRLLDHVGISFDPACLEFHRGKRAVRSASAEQVRRPINREGVDHWRAFDPWLGELKDALGPALKNWDKA